MKVLHITSGLKGGAGIAATALNEELRKLNIDSSIISSHESSMIRKLISKIFTALNFLISVPEYDFLTIFSNKGITSRYINKVNPDVIHIHNWFNCLSFKQIERLSKKHKLVFTIHDERNFTGGCHDSQNCPNFLNSCTNCPRLRTLKNFTHKNYSRQKRFFNDPKKNLKIIVPNEWLISKNVSRFFNDDLTRISEIPNIINIYPVSRLNSQEARDKIKFLFVASNCAVQLKGLDILIKSIEILIEKGISNFSLTIVGNNFNSKNILTALPIEHIPFQSSKNLSRIYTDHDVTVVPSRTDNSPNVILESLSAGVPVLGSRRGGIPNLIKSGKNGELFEPDPTELSNILEMVIMKNVTFDTPQAIMRDFSQRYSPELVIYKHLEIYRELIHG